MNSAKNLTDRYSQPPSTRYQHTTQYQQRQADQSLRMFLDDLKNEEQVIPEGEESKYVEIPQTRQPNLNESSSSSEDVENYSRHYQSNGRGGRAGSTSTDKAGVTTLMPNLNKVQRQSDCGEISSLESSMHNLKMQQLQEQSFSKMQLEIASLQNKIKGLESKLTPLSSQQTTQYRRLEDLPKQILFSHGEIGNNVGNTACFENKENVMQSYPAYEKQAQWLHMVDDQATNQISKISDLNSNDLQSKYSFPLRLKPRQYNQQPMPQTEFFTEKYEEINDSRERLQSGKHSSQHQSKEELPPAVIKQERYKRFTEVSSDDEDSTISKQGQVQVSSIRQRTFQKEAGPKKESECFTEEDTSKQHRYATKERFKHCGIIKQHKGQDLEIGALFRIKRTHPVTMQQCEQQPWKLSCQWSHSVIKVQFQLSILRASQILRQKKQISQELKDLRRNNALLLVENDTLKRQVIAASETEQKYIELKSKHKLVIEKLAKSEQARRDQLEMFLDQKKTVRTLKKKMKFFKERLKKYCQMESIAEEKKPVTVVKKLTSPPATMNIDVKGQQNKGRVSGASCGVQENTGERKSLQRRQQSANKSLKRDGGSTKRKSLAANQHR